MDEQRPSAEDFPRETLVAALRDNGVSYLVPGDADTDEVLKSPVRLLSALLPQPDARLKLAIVPLFLRQPSLAESVPTLAARLDAPQSLELQTLYMAAVYLQRNWRVASEYLPGRHDPLARSVFTPNEPASTGGTIWQDGVICAG